MSAPTLFDASRTTLGDSLALTTESLRTYAERYQHWCFAYSGGKDSTTAVTVAAHLMDKGEIPTPKSMTVAYADTRLELPPLQTAAMQILDELRDRGFRTEVVFPPIDDRFMVYMLGRGVPPPNNKTLRWCTSQIKIEPMHARLRALRDEIGEKMLMITGVRLGESAARDERIVTSCSRDNTECGQGWLQIHTPEAVADTLASILHWRVCHVWAWLTAHAPELGFATRPIATAYGGDEAEEINARTGCMGCPLASRDRALEAVCKLIEWAYLSPLLQLRGLWHELRFTRAYRLRKAGIERLKDGSIASNPQRLGPLTMDARRYGLNRILEIQGAVNADAQKLGRPLVDIINAEEEARIRELIDLNTWPQKWSGEEPVGDELLELYHADGSVQPLLTIFGNKVTA